MILSIITAAFNTEIEVMFEQKPEIKKYLLQHERKNLCIENLTRELKYAELRAAIKMDHKRIVELTRDIARAFAKASLDHHKITNESDYARGERLRKIARQAEYERNLDSDIIDL